MPTARRSLPPIVQRSALTYHADLRPHGCARHRAQTSAPLLHASGAPLQRAAARDDKAACELLHAEIEAQIMSGASDLERRTRR